MFSDASSMGLKIGRDRHCLAMMRAVADGWKSSFSPLTFPRVLSSRDPTWSHDGERLKSLLPVV